jgi:hypothetical protein
MGIVYGIIFQVLCILTTTLLANNLRISVSIIDWCWIFGVVTIILFFPISIGGIGVREGSFIGILGFMGVTSEKAIALSFSIFSLELLLGILGGILDCKTMIK